MPALGELQIKHRISEQFKRARVVALLVLTVCIASIPHGEASGQRLAADPLEEQTAAFIATVDTLGPTALEAFFPRTGIFTYRRTVHTPEGSRVGAWRLQSSEVRAALDGPLAESFDMQFESQRIGLFEHQMKLRGREWHRVSETRFVPAGATMLSDIYIEWRREGSEWVISEFGDEVYASGVALPEWCC